MDDGAIAAAHRRAGALQFLARGVAIARPEQRRRSDAVQPSVVGVHALGVGGGETFPRRNERLPVQSVEQKMQRAAESGRNRNSRRLRPVLRAAKLFAGPLEKAARGARTRLAAAYPERVEQACVFLQ